MFPIEKQINFTIGIKSGDVENYLIELNGQLHKNLTNNITIFKTNEVNTEYNLSHFE